ncbi:MAG: L-threonylcarbamoyladenylate synthase [Candidatus Anstonellaceae archaeon]
MKINIPPYKKALKECVLALKAGKTILYPTDTLYGIGVDATNRKAIKKIMKIKKRKDDKFSVIVEKERIGKYADVPKKYKKLIDIFLPGPYTFLLKAKKKLPIVKNNIIAIRVPKNKFCILLSKALRKPIISTSANISGKSPHYSFDLVPNTIKKQIEVLVDGGKCHYKKGSTIIDLVNKKIVRIGAGYRKIKKYLANFHD